MNVTVTFYELQSGRILDGHFSGPKKSLRSNTPDGCGYIHGLVDHLCFKVDIESGKLVACQPRPPSPDHEWNHVTERWQLKPEVVERQRQAVLIKSQLQKLDASELRAQGDLIDLLTGSAEPAPLVEAQQRLAAVRADKESLRSQLRLLTE